MVLEFNQNGDTKGGGLGKAMLPNAEGGLGAVHSLETYLSYFDNAVKKAGVSIPPSMQNFATLEYMPDLSNSGIVQWRGIPPESLAKIAGENITPQMIIGMRIADVLSYANLSHHPWKRGWRIGMREADADPTKEDSRTIREAERFLLNCNSEYTGSERDAKGYTSFRQFLAMLTRTSLTYDGMAVWKDNDSRGRVQAFKCLDAGSIRLAKETGYQGDPDIFAVAVDQTGTIMHTFTRQQLTWYVRNPSADPSNYGYGLSELQTGVRLIQGFQNAIDMNIDTFNRNHIPNGMLLLHGVGWVQRQLDVLARQWNNMKAGITKQWVLPALVVPKDGDIKILDLTDIKGKEAYYADLMNMTVGAFCTIYRFPPHRLGYKISGTNSDSELPNQTAMERVDQEDIGKEELLGHIEIVMNEYILWSRYPHLQFEFTGKNPKEDAREYEERQLAMTIKERRANVGLPSLEKSADTKDETMLRVAQAMDIAPLDPGVAGIYQALISSQGLTNKGVGPEGMIDPKTDAAESEKHGAVSGTRRDSKAEETPAKKPVK
jgi:hypothetical protein